MKQRLHYRKFTKPLSSNNSSLPVNQDLQAEPVVVVKEVFSPTNNYLISNQQIVIKTNRGLSLATNY